MHLLITGGTGFIGRPLVETLLARGDQITLLTRDFDKAKKMFDGRVNLIGSVKDSGLEVDGVINLAGAPIIDKRWTTKRKKILKESRIGITGDIITWISRCTHKPKVLVSGSAIGYYGNYPEAHRLDERAQPRQCFASKLCQEWEETAFKAEALGVRVCTVRTGVVLAKHGGALKRMWLPFTLGLGGRIATGNQWFSWIHLQDMIDILLYLVDNEPVRGAVNAAAPNPVTNYVFAKKFAKWLKRPALFPMPAAVVGVLFGEASELLLDGQQVIPRKLLERGFKFKYSQVDQALKDIVE